jgi:SAM-dependent methyltransferase
MDGSLGTLTKTRSWPKTGGYYVVNAYLHFAKRVHAIEYDTRLCDLLRQELVRFPERCTWQQGSILSLPVESASADLVACTQVLEHIDDELRAFGELTRILKPGDYLLLAVPHPPAPWPEPGHVREGYRVESGNSLRSRGHPFRLLPNLFNPKSRSPRASVP